MKPANWGTLTIVQGDDEAWEFTIDDDAADFSGTTAAQLAADETWSGTDVFSVACTIDSAINLQLVVTAPVDATDFSSLTPGTKFVSIVADLRVTLASGAKVTVARGKIKVLPSAQG
jgi:hypothetical protein